jgi:hypothetical protein
MLSYCSGYSVVQQSVPITLRNKGGASGFNASPINVDAPPRNLYSIKDNRAFQSTEYRAAHYSNKVFLY